MINFRELFSNCLHRLVFTNLTKIRKGLFFAKLKPIKVWDPIFQLIFFSQPRKFLSTFICPQIFLGILKFSDFIYTSVSRLIKFKMKCLNPECYSEYRSCWNEGMRLKDFCWLYLEFKYWIFIYIPWIHKFFQSEIFVVFSSYWMLGKNYFREISPIKVANRSLFFFLFFFLLFLPFQVQTYLEINILIDSLSHNHNESCETFMRVFNIT